MHVITCPSCGRVNRGSVLPVHCPSCLTGSEPPEPRPIEERTVAQMAEDLGKELANPPKGVGDYMADLIPRWAGALIKWFSVCDCKSYRGKMNRWGPSGCRRRFDQIVLRFVLEAKAVRFPAWATAWWFRWKLRVAIERAEEAEKEKGT